MIDATLILTSFYHTNSTSVKFNSNKCQYKYSEKYLNVRSNSRTC